MTRPILADRQILGIDILNGIGNVHTNDVSNIDADIGDEENVQGEEHDFRKCFLIGMTLASVLLAIMEF